MEQKFDSDYYQIVSGSGISSSIDLSSSDDYETVSGDGKYAPYIAYGSQSILPSGDLFPILYRSGALPIPGDANDFPVTSSLLSKARSMRFHE